MTLLVKVMIAIREPAKANAILDQLALMNPTALVDAAAAAGIVNRGVRVDSALSFPVEYVEQKLFNQVRDLAVKAVRAYDNFCFLQPMEYPTKEQLADRKLLFSTAAGAAINYVRALLSAGSEGDDNNLPEPFPRVHSYDPSGQRRTVTVQWGEAAFVRAGVNMNAPISISYSEFAEFQKQFKLGKYSGQRYGQAFYNHFYLQKSIAIKQNNWGDALYNADSDVARIMVIQTIDWAN